MSKPKPFAVKVIVSFNDGSKAEQKHVRGSVRLSKGAFASMALGNTLRMLALNDDDKGIAVTGWTIEEVQVGPFG